MKEVKGKHIGSYGLIIKNDQVALIKKARGGYTGLLDLPGGGIEHNETPVEALHRELQGSRSNSNKRRINHSNISYF